MNNQECRAIPQIVNLNGDEAGFFTFSNKTSKCSGSCNNINNPYAKLCVPDVVKSLYVKVFNLMSRTSETRHIEWHEPCKSKCRLEASVFNNKQRWNDDKYRCECKELIDKGLCDKGSICNPNNCECECDKSCDFRKYLGYQNCKCRKKFVDKLVEEFTETFEEVKLAKRTSAENENVCKCSSCTLYIFSCLIIFAISVRTGIYFVYYKYMNLDKTTGAKEQLYF